MSSMSRVDVIHLEGCVLWYFLLHLTCPEQNWLHFSPSGLCRWHHQAVNFLHFICPFQVGAFFDWGTLIHCPAGYDVSNSLLKSKQIMSYVFFLSGVCVTSLKNSSRFVKQDLPFIRLCWQLCISSRFSRCFVISSLINVSIILSSAEVTVITVNVAVNALSLDSLLGCIRWHGSAQDGLEA